MSRVPFVESADKTLPHPNPLAESERILSVVGWREEGTQSIGHLGDGHGLNPDISRAGHYGVENTFSAEEHVFHTGHCADIQTAGAVHSGQISGVNYHLLTGGQGVLLHIAVELHEGYAAAGEPLHDEALSAEQRAANLLLKKHGQLHAGSGGQESGFLSDEIFPGTDLKGPDGARGNWRPKAMCPGPPWAV